MPHPQKVLHLYPRLRFIVELRQHFLDAKILGLSEIDSKELHSRNIIVSDTMNVLRRELSDML